MGAQPELDLTMTVLSVSHVTLYRYNRPVSFGPHRTMFRPRDSYDQKLLEAALTITVLFVSAIIFRAVRVSAGSSESHHRRA